MIDQPPEPFLIYDSAGDQQYGGKRMLIFSSRWGLDHLARQEHWAADGTIDVVPSIFQQLYTIHGIILGQSMPLVYALMGEKSEAAYIQMLRVVKEKVTEEHDGCMFHGTVMTDAERASINTFQAVFPLKSPQICFFHNSVRMEENAKSGPCGSIQRGRRVRPASTNPGCRSFPTAPRG